MTDWYYHDPAQGRVGPHTADEMRARFRDRRIQRDTLVWHAGLREWQPLEHQIVELDLAGVKPDASAPPPLPPVMPRASQARPSPTPHAHGPRRPAQAQKGGLSGCAIAVLVAAALAVPLIGIVAAIAVPAYRDYVVRSKTHSSVYGAAVAIEHHVDAWSRNTGRCPVASDMAPIIQQVSRSMPRTTLRFTAVEGDRCAFEFTLGGIDSRTDGKTWLFVSYEGEEGPVWDCTGGDLPARFRPVPCQAE
ncbi:MAG TPA: GYF domain-containing protein [Lysobacter sp.]